MSNLPRELLDYIVDLLYDSQTPGQFQLELRSCCLVSKSWIPRTRRHLFAETHFQTAESLRLWKKTFRDLSTSPAYYTKVLLVGGPRVLTAVDEKAPGWIGVFSRVVCLELVGQDPHCSGWWAACVILRGFSPVIKSLRMYFSAFAVYPASQLFDLVHSYPLLEDLSVANSYYAPVNYGGDSDELLTTVQPYRLDMFTGSLDISLRGGTEAFIRWLLSLPGGIHFRKLTLKWICNEDISMTMAFMYSQILESLDIADNCSYGMPPWVTSFSSRSNIGFVQSLESTEA